MITLAIDTAFDACSAAIIGGEKVLWSEQRIIGKGHSEVLPPMIAAGLGAAGVRPADIDRIGVVVGPGAFAGVRVGLAFARAFKIGLNIDVVGVASTEALAGSLARAGGLTAAVFDARRGQVYAALYDAAMEEILPPFAANPGEAAIRLLTASKEQDLRLAGSGATLLALDRPHAIDRLIHADPAAIARLARAKPTPPAPPAPLYLRPPDAAPASATLFAGLEQR